MLVPGGVLAFLLAVYGCAAACCRLQTPAAMLTSCTAACQGASCIDIAILLMTVWRALETQVKPLKAAHLHSFSETARPCLSATQGWISNPIMLTCQQEIVTNSCTSLAAQGWICNSSICMTRRGMRPTGIAIFEAQAQGFECVAHLVAHRLGGGKSDGNKCGRH